MLVGPSGERITHHDVLVLHCSSNAVWDDTVVGEVAATDDIASPSCGNRNTTIRKETVLVGMRHQFRAGLGVGVWIISI